MLSVVFSPDGTCVVSSPEDCIIYIWNFGTAGELITGPFEGHTHAVLCTMFSPDGTCVVSGSHNCTICIWNTGTGKVVAIPFEGYKRVLSTPFSSDGLHGISGSDNHTICIWDTGVNQMVQVACTCDGQQHQPLLLPVQQIDREWIQVPVMQWCVLGI